MLKKGDRVKLSEYAIKHEIHPWYLKGREGVVVRDQREGEDTVNVRWDKNKRANKTHQGFVTLVGK